VCVQEPASQKGDGLNIFVIHSAAVSSAAVHKFAAANRRLMAQFLQIFAGKLPPNFRFENFGSSLI
jgi:hypothetical protein